MARVRSWPRPTGLLAETAVAGALLLVLGIAVFGSHVVHGGFYYDDWANSAYTHYPPPGKSVLGLYFNLTGYRPLLALYIPALHDVFGTHMGWLLGWALLLAVAMCTLLFAVLRELGLERVYAALIAGLVLIFPFSDATRLWTTSSTANLTIAIYLGGLLLALRGLRKTRVRSQVLYHAGAVALYVCSILLYELTTAIAFCSGALYLWVSRSPRRAGVRFAADAVAIIAAGIVVSSSSKIDETHSWHGRIEHAKDIADQGLTMLASTALPFGTPRRASVLLLALGVIVLGIIVQRLLPAADPAKRHLLRWIALVPAGLAVALLGYAIFIPADRYYVPLQAGVGNRVNALAAIGLVIAAFAIVGIAGTLVVRGLSNWRRWTLVFVACGSLFLGVGYIRHVNADKGKWDRAFAAEEQVLTAVKRAVPNPRPNSIIYTFDHSLYQAPGIPVFAAGWDLNGALQLTYHSHSVRGLPALAPLACGSNAVYPNAAGYGPASRGRYGNAYFVNVTAYKATLIKDRATCRAAVRKYVPDALLTESH